MLTITCYLATVIVDGKINDDEQMHLVRWLFWRPQRCAGAIQTASLNAACPRLLRKPLDTGIGQLLAPHCPSGHQGNYHQNNNQTIHPLCWPFWWPSWWSGTIPRILPDRDGSGLQWKPLVATIGRVLQPIVGIERKKTPVFTKFFHCHLLQKGSRWCYGP